MESPNLNGWFLKETPWMFSFSAHCRQAFKHFKLTLSLCLKKKKKKGSYIENWYEILQKITVEQRKAMAVPSSAIHPLLYTDVLLAYELPGIATLSLLVVNHWFRPGNSHAVTNMKMPLWACLKYFFDFEPCCKSARKHKNLNFFSEIYYSTNFYIDFISVNKNSGTWEKSRE